MDDPKDKTKLPKISSVLQNESIKFDLYESNIEPYLRFTHKMEIQMANWVTVKNTTKDNEMSRCQHSYIANYASVKKLDRQETCNLTLGSWDIEAFSHSTRYENKNDFISSHSCNQILFFRKL